MRNYTDVPDFSVEDFVQQLNRKCLVRGDIGQNTAANFIIERFSFKPHLKSVRGVVNG